ncbi:helix-turn-helix domain-containing protein [Candidatus Stoquefichus sp. SB1]|jgi:transcriptional regulator with XRE-family HTH domain|uniref:helix-turn-helix domain-containing protein n=1 Tax=Candidatus Stoquefichus sp. SB1 TaxID=1658109 RepID=UPI00067E83B0|nr:helix-turn-helix transcriptional regulator [Candidatus Stoquefichus sp. SB1]
MEDINMKFGRRIKELRLIQNISQEELGFRCQLSKNYVSDVERGTRNVSLKVIEKFALGLKVPLYYLFKWHDDEE